MFIIRPPSPPRWPARRRGTAPSPLRRAPAGRRRRAAAAQAAAARLPGEAPGGGSAGPPLFSTACAMKLLRLAPTRSGRPSGASSSRRAIRARFCSAVLPKPIPGSSTICSLSTPQATARSTAAASSLRTSPRRSRKRMPRCMVGELAAAVHEDQRAAGRGHSAAERGVGERAHVVDQVGAGRERAPRHLALAGVDGERRRRWRDAPPRAPAGGAPPLPPPATSARPSRRPRRPGGSTRRRGRAGRPPRRAGGERSRRRAADRARGRRR